jgi:hypothetical protein
MTPVTKGWPLGLLTPAKVDRLRYGGFPLDRDKFTDLVRAITKGLGFAKAAGAPKVRLPCLNSRGTRRFLGNVS